MLFSSFEFILAFLPITFLTYFLLQKLSYQTTAKVWLISASLFFYGWWDINYLPVILSSIFINYVISQSLIKNKSAKTNKALLASGIIFNIALLGHYKYTDFIISNINALTNGNLEVQNIVLPLAISFVTFQQIAYLVDCYRGEVKSQNPLDYALFITFFPQLIAGPIVHHKEMMPQFKSATSTLLNYRNICIGLFIFSLGLFKKVVIADAFAKWANAGFDASSALNFYQAWSTSLSYTFQLYFDFSGYVDMAIGLALLFNIKLPQNFNSPYKSLDIQDFWRRWHITLGRFLRDYIYIPLGGNRSGEWRMHFNLFITFLIGGIWHGASWMFVIWGALHGTALIIHRVWQRLGFKLWKWLAWLITFNFVNITWVFFRAKDMDAALRVLTGMVSLESFTINQISTQNLAWGGTLVDFIGSSLIPNGILFNAPAFFAICIAFLILVTRNTIELSGLYSDTKPAIETKHMIYAGFLLSASCIALLASTSTVFLYFNF